MSIYPTRTAAHLAIAGVVAFGIGIALRESVVVAWGGAVLVAVSLARAVTLVSVMRIRAAGFEMLWTGAARVKRTHPGGVVTLHAEVRNRDTLSARYDKLRVVASPALQTWVEPLAGQVPATGSVKLLIHVRALRVGHHGVYGLALEVRGAPGLFEVPLTFANPYGIEVMPRALARPLVLPHGGRSQTTAMVGRSGRQRGDGTDLHELRELLPGDSFRRIAWKASAKRGQLVVKEFEREERDVVMLVLDASVELWSGAMGGAPLDRAIDLTATLAAHHAGRGDYVGLSIVASRELCRVDADGGRQQASRIVAALMEHTGVLDADRCGWDESDVAVQVTEHLRPLDPRAVSDLRHNRIDRLVKRADAMLSHAPFARSKPLGRNDKDERLRRYAACFGLHAPARLEPDRGRTTQRLCEVLLSLATKAKGRGARVSIVHVIAPPPLEGQHDMLRRAVRRLRGKRVEVRWTTPPVATPIDVAPSDELIPEAQRPERPAFGRLHHVVERTVVMRAALANKKGEESLRRMGVKVLRAQRPNVARVVAGDPAQEVA
jgi:uncharacterized protein (DUF58 family)